MDALLRRRQMMLAGGTPPAPIPDGPVDYIETDGVAYIDTGIVGATPKSCELEAIFVNNSFACLLGSRVANEGMRFQPIMNYSYRVDMGFSNSYINGVSIESSITNQTPVVVRAMLHNATGSYIEAKQNGESSYTRQTTTVYPGGGAGTIATTGLNLFLFALNYGGSAISKEPSGTRLYYCKIYSDTSFSTLLFDGVPYKYNGRYGLWDNVSDTFFGNAASSGKFKGGIIVQPAYTEVAYIQSDGTAYINTGIKAGSPVGYSVDMKVTFVANGGKMMGARDGERRVIPVALSSTGLLSLGFYVFYNVVDVTSSVTNQTPICIKCSMQKDSQVMQVKLDGESSYTTYTKSDNATINSTLDQYLFAHNYSSGLENVASGTKLFYCKIYSDTNYSTLVFDGVPCYYNGAYGLWDRITDSFFGNAAGSGAFTGPQI